MWGDAHYDLVLTDPYIPTRDGYELAALIHEKPNIGAIWTARRSLP